MTSVAKISTTSYRHWATESITVCSLWLERWSSPLMLLNLLTSRLVHAHLVLLMATAHSPECLYFVYVGRGENQYTVNTWKADSSTPAILAYTVLQTYIKYHQHPSEWSNIKIYTYLEGLVVAQWKSNSWSIKELAKQTTVRQKFPHCQLHTLNK